MIGVLNDKRKRLLIIICIFILLIVSFIFSKIWNGYCFEVYVNHNVSLWNPLNVETVYRYEFGEGEDFYIFNYASDKDIRKIIKKNNFKKITKDNLKNTIKILNKYRDDLCEKELKLFDRTVNISELSTIGNYYLYVEGIEDDGDYCIGIIFPKDKKIYYFNINH